MSCGQYTEDGIRGHWTLGYWNKKSKKMKVAQNVWTKPIFTNFDVADPNIKFVFMIFSPFRLNRVQNIQIGYFLEFFIKIKFL